MLRASIVLIALIGASAAFRVVFDQSLNSHWELYKTKHGKTYNTDEDQQRRITWEGTVKFINQHNLKADLGLTTYRMGLNKFTDMTNDEFRAYKGLRFNATALRGKAQTNVLLPPIRLPASVDWRKEGYVTPVKDQGQCGSCWAFSTTGSLEGQHFKATNKLVSLSEQNLVDCSGSEGNMGCNGGLMDQAFAYIKKNGGIDTEKSYPYTAQDGDCKYNKNNVGAKVTGFHDVKSQDESDLQNSVATIGPVSVAIDAGNPSFQSYSSGVYDEPECSSTMLDHGVLAVGYGTTDDGKDFWIVKNSWGEIWGQKGYLLMSRNKDNQCGIATAASYPLV